MIAPVAGHHGTAAFDTSKMVKLKATVTDFQYVNPHVQLYFECKNDNGETEQWQGELTAPNKLNRAGWTKNTLKPGDSVTISGYGTKSGVHTIWTGNWLDPAAKSFPYLRSRRRMMQGSLRLVNCRPHCDLWPGGLRANSPSGQHYTIRSSAPT